MKTIKARPRLAARAKPARRRSARAKPSAAPRRKRALAGPGARRRTPRRPQQVFVVSHHRDEDFVGGLRSYAQYRDLGMAAATSGLAQAHVIRFLPPFKAADVSVLHYHDVEFQMVYVLKGWIKTELEGQGTHVMRAGSAWIQPPRIRHVVLDYSHDCEVLEVVLPADFKTVELA